MKRILVLCSLFVVVGCLVKQAPPSGDSGQAEGETGNTQEDVSYYGTAPSSPVSAPVFAATNRDGTARGQSDLIGQPTVMWFYPMAGTYG